MAFQINQTVFHTNYCKNQNSILKASEIIISGYIHDNYTLPTDDAKQELFLLLETPLFNEFALWIKSSVSVCVDECRRVSK